MHPTTDGTNERASGDDGCSADGSGFADAAKAVPEPVRRLIRGTHNDRGLGLLLTIDDRGGVPVRELLRDDLCESDLHGLCGELRAAGLLEPCEVAGERGYRTTETAHEALERLHAT